ncbi:CDF family Co(II)/Ni(II) efflux transporter DmeF [Agrobacterium sp. a22-2]|uniref:CDF family Co(II)/Ni(II) efflux transporter DmeF n=1 Tax=Agrobacterium sp. a22-2 TaxID=2283840 RepID=UPI001446E63E|nr:CDF family Co(II)/Ni(II) efflux transporter DmeF [Agrobacterium sp. a22-2]NKN39685.1 CDF family Co(II)/Ni(II) efflux transporter DmeF [Agrobacterium sp. a22-2]
MSDHHHDGHSHPHPNRGAKRLASRHDHMFLGDDHERNARRTWIVIAITATMMVLEIVAGSLFGSMALTADGWHMATHAGAILIAALAYHYARRNVGNPDFTFGTGKFGDLAAFASAIILGIVALLIGWESLMRLRAPVSIDFNEAILVAVLGLAVNLVCAWLLKDDHGHHHGHGSHAHHSAGAHSHDHHHDHPHGHDHAAHSTHHDHANDGRESHAGRDQNLRAAYLHVLADALTSVLAIAALVAGTIYGWLWLDPVIGMVGALVIARWSFGLIRDSGAVLLDRLPSDDHLSADIRDILEKDGAEIADLHVWQLGPGHHGAIVSLNAAAPRAPSYYRERLAPLKNLSHVTVEVELKSA